MNYSDYETVVSSCIEDILSTVKCPEDCGKCCRIAAQVKEEEKERFSGNLETVVIKGQEKLYLKHDKNGQYCVYYDTNMHKCKIYPSRPDVCKSYPFIVGPLIFPWITLQMKPSCFVSMKIKSILFSFAKCNGTVEESEYFKEVDKVLKSKGLGHPKEKCNDVYLNYAFLEKILLELLKEKYK